MVSPFYIVVPMRRERSLPVDFELSEDQATIRRAVAELAAKFDDQYWLEKDAAHEFPTEFYQAFADGGWLGITIPEEYGGHGFGVTEAGLVVGGGGGFRPRGEGGG